jgi:hypothetical protein
VLGSENEMTFDFLVKSGYKVGMDKGVIIAIIIIAIFGSTIHEWMYRKPGRYFRDLVENKLPKDSRIRKILLFKIRQ